jgi:hypothetical protein
MIAWLWPLRRHKGWGQYSSSTVFTKSPICKCWLNFSLTHLIVVFHLHDQSATWAVHTSSSFNRAKYVNTRSASPKHFQSHSKPFPDRISRMAGPLWWESTHALCVFGHFGMIVTSFIAFVFTVGELVTSDQFMSLKLVPFAGFSVVS